MGEPETYMGLRIIQSTGLRKRVGTMQVWSPSPIGAVPPGANPRISSRRRRWVVIQDAGIYEEPTDVIIDRLNGVLYCTPAQYVEIKRQFEARRSPV